MDVKDYCSGMEHELMAWKAKLFDVVAKTDAMGTKEKEKVWANFNDMKMIIQDLEDEIQTLKTECPSDWGPQKKKIEDAHVNVRSKYNETLEYIGKAAPVSVPG
ncbi:MAG: hypothetical protein SWH61_06580 [Thermodesulfobacteriota bacterium]|nr:hypothetical protein [Thermodesulfobacteriota bacterium]